jgi:hypothetical protein
VHERVSHHCGAGLRGRGPAGSGECLGGRGVGDTGLGVCADSFECLGVGQRGRGGGSSGRQQRQHVGRAGRVFGERGFSVGFRGGGLGFDGFGLGQHGDRARDSGSRQRLECGVLGHLRADQRGGSGDFCTDLDNEGGRCGGVSHGGAGVGGDGARERGGDGG